MSRRGWVKLAGAILCVSLLVAVASFAISRTNDADCAGPSSPPMPAAQQALENEGVGPSYACNLFDWTKQGWPMAYHNEFNGDSYHIGAVWSWMHFFENWAVWLGGTSIIYFAYNVVRKRKRKALTR